MALYDQLDAGKLEQLRELRRILAEAIDSYENPRDLAPLSTRFIEVVTEIERLDGTNRDAATVTDLADRIRRNRERRARAE